MAQLIAEEAGVRLLLYHVPPTEETDELSHYYELETRRQTLPRVFKNMDEAIAAYRREVEAWRQIV